MSNKRYTRMVLALSALVVSILACNAPTPTPSAPQEPPPTMTPIPATLPPQETQSPPSTETTPSEATESPAVTDASPTPTGTATREPTVTPTPTLSPPGEPLEVGIPGYEIVDWEPLPEGGWGAHIRIIFTGGTPPYTFSLQHEPPQSENYLYWTFRKKCGGGEAIRADVWSADGQHAHRDLWITSPYCPEGED